jgi:predicted dehydrogenase
MRFLIAGYGSAGRRHLKNLLALGQEDIVLYRSGMSTLPGEEPNQFPSESEWTRALEHKPDAVIVSNPTALHLEVAIPAAAAGCHLLIEKPVSHSMERVDDLIEAAESSGARVCIGFQYRFHPGLQKAHRWIEQGAIGQPATARAHYADYLPGWHPWEDYRRSYSARSDLGGGVIHTLCHPLDYLRWLLGEVDSVWATSARLGGLDIEVDDTAEIGMSFSTGAVGTVHLDYIQQPPSHEFEIVGSEASIHWDQTDGIARLTPYAGTSGEGGQSAAGFDRDDMFLFEMRHFLQVCRGEAEPLCPLSEGVASLRLAVAVERAARERKMISPVDRSPGKL